MSGVCRKLNQLLQITLLYREASENYRHLNETPTQEVQHTWLAVQSIHRATAKEFYIFSNEGFMNEPQPKLLCVKSIGSVSDQTN